MIQSAEVLEKYFTEGKTYWEIAEIEGVSTTTVKNWAKKYGLSGERKRGPALKKKVQGEKLEEAVP